MIQAMTWSVSILVAGIGLSFSLTSLVVLGESLPFMLR